jgi:hypothetical protein
MSVDHLSAEKGSLSKGSLSRLIGQHLKPFCRDFVAPMRSRLLCGHASGGVARRRGASRVPQMCPECVRVFNVWTTTKCRFAGTLGKPSDGLEPSTPSLPWHDLGNWSQPTATVLPSLRGFPCSAICYRLPPVASAGLFLKKGRSSSSRLVDRTSSLLLPDGWTLISFLALVAHRVDGSCPGFSIP